MLCLKDVGFFLSSVLLMVQSCYGAEIIGGKPVDPRSMPYMVLLETNNGACGGALIDPQWVLTAAHCDKVKKVLLGVKSIKQPQQVQGIKTSFPHPCFNKYEMVNDLMLLKLKKRVKETDLVKPLKLSKTITEPPAGSSCLVAGWGVTNNSIKKMSDVLMAVNVTVIDRMKCNSPDHYNFNPVITHSMICAGSDGNKPADTCKGDSGGPLLCNNVLVGVTSFGGFPCGAKSKPGVYSFLSKAQLDWIRKTMKKSSEI